MKIVTPALLVLVLVAACPATEPRDIPLDRLGSDFRLVGKLHVPLGQVVALEGVVVVGEGGSRESEGAYLLRVQRIRGRATQEDIQIIIQPFFRPWGETAGGRALPKLVRGATYEMEGYATGGYVGVPAEVFQKGAEIVATTDHYFREEFTVIRAKRIAPIVFAPHMFAGERALLQGRAKSRAGKAFLVGDGWNVKVIQDAPWPRHVEGKRVETWGRYNPDSDRKGFDLVEGQWRLVRLEDQLGRDVMLRGRARSLNGVWWFHYRGVDLYVEGLENLPGWTTENHWRPMVIRGRLDKATLPRLDEVTLKADRDRKEYFIVRNASWEPLPALLSPETPMPTESTPSSR